MAKEAKWLPVDGYEGIYEVSDSGLVRNAATGHVLRFSMTYNGYCRVKLYKRIDGKRHNETFMVHRLVASAFIGKPSGKTQVNHIDGCKTNNHADNLEWCTQSENLSHSVRIGLRDMSKCTDATKKAVEQIALDGSVIKVWASMSEAARTLNIPVGNISHCCIGRIKHAGGFKWCFVI